MAGETAFTPSEADYVAAMKLNYVRQLQARRFWIRMSILACTAASLVATVILLTDRDIWRAATTGAVSALSGMAALLVVIGANFVFLPRRAGRLYRQQKTLHRETTFSWDDHGTAWRNEAGETLTAWSDYHKWTAAGSTVLLYLNDQLFQFVPTRTLSEVKLQDLEADLRCKVPSR